MKKILFGLAALFLIGIFFFAMSLNLTDPGLSARNFPPPQPIEKVENIYELINRWTEDGALQKIESQLKAGFNLDVINTESTTSGYGQTPLTLALLVASPQMIHYAADVRANRYDVVTLILKYNPNINFRNDRGETPLHIAVNKGDIDLTSELIARGADINAEINDGRENSYKRSMLDATFPFGDNAFKILMAKGVKYDPEKILDTVFQFGSGSSSDPFLETFLSYPIEIPESYRDRLAYNIQQKDPNRIHIAGIIAKHMDLMNAAKKSGNPPELSFKRAPVLFKQIVPPVEDPEIVTAVRSGDLVKVKSLINHGTDVNAVSRVMRQNDDYKEIGLFSAPILHIAIQKKYDEIADFLIDKGAKVDMTDAKGKTPLFLAVSTNNYKIVQKLVSKGTDVNQPELEYGSTPLEQATDVQIVNFLLSKKADPNHISNYGSVMHAHAHDKTPDILKSLIAHGGKINLAGYEGNTPLQQILNDDYSKEITVDQVKNLVQLGADLKIKNDRGFTAYDIAIEKDRNDIADYLQHSGAVSGDQESVLNNALYKGDVETVKRVLEGGYSAKDFRYALAAISNSYKIKPADQLAILKLLAEHGTNLSGSDSGRQGATLLHMTSDPDTIDFLVSQGVDVNGIDANRTTPLHVWARAGNVSAVTALIKNKAFPNPISEEETPLCQALQGPINRTPADGPPIHWGVDELPYLEVIRVLMAAGADPNLVNKKKCLPYSAEPEYESFRKQADKIMSESKVIVSQKPPLVIKKTYKLIPITDVQFLFGMVSAQYLNKDQAEKYQSGVDIQGVCNLPVIEVAKKLYEANPESAPDFKTFLNSLTLRKMGTYTSYNGVDTLPTSPYRGYNLLHMAAYYSDVGLVKQLLDIGVDPKAIDAIGNTALHYATNSRGKRVKEAMEISQILIDRGIDINAQNFDGESALFTGAFMSFSKDQPVPHYQLISYLLDHGANPKVNESGLRNFADVIQYALKSATEYGQPSHQEPYKTLLEKLRKQGIEPQFNKPDDGKSRERLLNDPLLKAIRENNIEKVREAIAAGADVNQRTGGISPIFYSVKNGDANLEITKLLVDKGARLDGPVGYEPLIARATFEKTVRYLIDHGVKPKSSDLLEMQSIRSKSLTSSARRALELILQQGIDPNVCKDYGTSPLLNAVQSQNVEAVELLVQYGATPSACAQNPLESSSSINFEIKSILEKAPTQESPSILSDLIKITDPALSTCTETDVLIPDAYRDYVHPKILQAPPIKLTPAQQDYAQGLAYFKGSGVAKDDVKAVEYFLRAANAGNAMAQHDLAYMYSVGQGVEKDEEKAFDWVKKSAEQGNSIAQDDLGVMYGDGRGVPQDLVQSYRWIALSARQGNAQAINDLEYIKRRMTPEQITEAEKLINK